MRILYKIYFGVTVQKPLLLCTCANLMLCKEVHLLIKFFSFRKILLLEDCSGDIRKTNTIT